MNPTVADRLVLRALARSDDGMTLAALHSAIAVDPESEELHTFVAEISAALVRLLMSGDVTVERHGEHLLYLQRDPSFHHGAVA